MNTMTETEARERWCPMAREMTAWDKDCKCIASKCMAWRWVRPEGLTPQGYKTDPDRGYCGAFGRPK